MRTIVYEAHNLEDKNLPIIFHYDIAKTTREGLANWHDNVEILYCAVGEGQAICNSVEYNLKKGDLVIVNSNMLHRMRAEERFEYYCLIVDSAFLKANEIPVDQIEFDVVVKSAAAAALYEKLIAEIDGKGEYRIAGIRSGVLELMVYLARNFSGPAVSGAHMQTASDVNMKLAIGYIRANYNQRLSLESVADKVGLSKYHFAREFKKVTGMTVIAYVNAMRCRNARKLLSQKRYSISEVARECGFENDSYFTRTFKSIVGCTPSEFVKLS